MYCFVCMPELTHITESICMFSIDLWAFDTIQIGERMYNPMRERVLVQGG